MEILTLFSFAILVLASLVQTNLVGGNSTTTTELPSSPEPPIQASTCPENSAISPCYCSNSFYGANIECRGSAVTQSSIETVFREIRRVNGISENRGIHIYTFEIIVTNLTQLDLTPFYGSQMDDLFITSNALLTKLVNSGNPEDQGSIHVSHFLRIASSPMNRSGFGDTLKYFSSNVTDFDVAYLDFSDYNDSLQGEFLPGLSSLTNLQELHIWDCGISGRLTSDTLIPKELQNLKEISLSHDSIEEIGENVFDFDGRSTFFCFLHLQNNKLNESSFHPNCGITRAGRRTNLVLAYNQISTLPASIFETFLDAHPDNSLSLNGNPLICDERLSWLKSRREEFSEFRVSGADCINDPGHTVFDSDLIP